MIKPDLFVTRMAMTCPKVAREAMLDRYRYFAHTHSVAGRVQRQMRPSQMLLVTALMIRQPSDAAPRTSHVTVT